jgi:hypothetical protein
VASATTGRRRSAEPRKRIQPRKPSARRAPVEQEPEVEILAADTVAEATARADERPVAIAGQTPASEAPAAAFGGTVYPGAPGLLPERQEELAGVPTLPERADRYPQDWFVAVLSAALAATVFLPWYHVQFGTRKLPLTGWQTGTWGPVVFFLALGSLALAVTRLAGVRVSLPLPHPTIHEGVGWVAIFAVLLKRLMRPALPDDLRFGAVVVQSWWILAPIIIGLLLAFMAGRMTSGPPLVIIPGWRRGREGAIGLALALVVVVGGIALGVTKSGSLDTVIRNKQNSALPGGGTNAGGSRPSAFKPLIGKFPACASSIPSPPGAKPETAVEQSSTTPCIWVMNAESKPDAILSFYRTALQKDGFTYTVSQSNAAGSTLSFTGKKCGNISIQNAQPGKKGSRVAVYLAPCPSAKATPRASTSPK